MLDVEHLLVVNHNADYIFVSFGVSGSSIRVTASGCKQCCKISAAYEESQ